MSVMVAPVTQLVLDFSHYSWADAKALPADGSQSEQIESVALILARVVKAIPRDWLVEDAPVMLDFTDPASFDWVQAPKMAKIQREIQEFHYEGSPIFTFERLSYRDEKELAKLYEAEMEKENTPEKIEKLIRAQELMFCKTVLSVPRPWLIAEAPDDLNWRDRKSYNYLQQPAYKALIEAFNTAKEDAGK